MDGSLVLGTSRDGTHSLSQSPAALEVLWPVWGPYSRKAIGVAGVCAAKSSKAMKGLEKQELTGAAEGLSCSVWRSLRADLMELPDGGCTVEEFVSSPCPITWVKQPWVAPGEVQIGHGEEFIAERDVRHWNRLPRGVLESPSQVWQRRERGTGQHGEVMGLDRSGWWLDLLTLKVFSNLDVPVIHWYVWNCYY